MDDIFEKVWNDLILDLLNQYKFDFNLKYNERKVKRKLAHLYYKQENHFKHSYMVSQTKHIDRHKIAACMLKSILILQPLKFPFISKVKHFFYKEEIETQEMEKMLLANQYLGLSIAISILESYIEADEQKKLRHKITLPEPFPEHCKDYLRDVCLDLYYTNPKQISTIAYANIFFLLEKYSCRKVQCDNFEKKCRTYIENEKALNVEEEIEKIRFSI